MGMDDRGGDDKDSVDGVGASNGASRMKQRKSTKEYGVIGEEGTEESPSRQNKGYEYYLEAMCLLHGHGIEANTGYALSWFERSAELGEPRAFYALGSIYEKGQGVRIDKQNAAGYFKRGAEQHHEPNAQFKLSQYYQKGGYEILGNDGKPNVKKAFKLLEDSANQDCGEAMRELGQVYEKGGMHEGEYGPFIKLIEVDLNKALDLY